MNWADLKKRLTPKVRGKTSAFVTPTVVLEVQPGFVAGGRVDGSAHQVKRMGVRELAAGALAPSVNDLNFTHPEEVQKGIREVGELVGAGSGRLGLVVPDGTVRVSVLAFEDLPRDRREAESLILWRMKESLPLNPEEARLSYQVFPLGDKAVEVLAVAARSSVIGEYEAAVDPLNGGAALILPATVAMLPLVPDGKGPAQLLLNVCAENVTAVVAAGNRIRLWRSRSLSGLAPDAMAADISREAARVLASSRDHLQLEIAQVWLAARPPLAPELMAELSRVAGREVKVLGPGQLVGSSLSPQEQTLLEQYGVTLAGLMANSLPPS